MKPTLLGLWLAAAVPLDAALAAALPEKQGYALLADLMAADGLARQRALGRLLQAGDRRWIAPTVDALFFVPKAARAGALRALAALTGEDRGDRYLDWVELVGEHAEWGVPADYSGWKARLFGRLDRRYQEILAAAPARIRLEEVVFGGVGVEGIPALDRPKAVLSTSAPFMADDELVFGVRVGGSPRAYPVRVLSWHEMVNDEVGGEPVSVSYCTLCGSGLAWSGRSSSGATLTFGTSGLLYRSNKLMLDRETRTLWSQLTGEAVIGPLASGDGERLRLLPTTVTRWREWRTRNPTTSVLEPDPQLARRWGFDYSPGAADRARAGVRFPVWPKDVRLAEREEVVGVRRGPHAKAFVVAEALRAGVVNDSVGGTAVVLIAEEGEGAVRAFERGASRFEREPATGDVRDDRGRRWRVEEDGLVCDDQRCAATETLARLPTAGSFWFAWCGFFPQTEVWPSPPVVP